jgi:hypothetical protein
MSPNSTTIKVEDQKRLNNQRDHRLREAFNVARSD